MKRAKAILIVLAVVGLSLVAQNALAVPALQLDIGGGWYEGDTIVTEETDFTLYAILTEKLQASVMDTYFISISIYPRVDDTFNPVNKAFQFAGETIRVSEDMTYGTAPMDEAFLQGWDAGDLPGHGIFPTYFYEYEFKFDETQTATTYNTMDYPGGPSISGTGGSYYFGFDVADAYVGGGFNLHFDLYSAELVAKYKRGELLTDTDVDLFAPFSHDAQKIPEPGSLLLLGVGIVGLAVFGRRLV